MQHAPISMVEVTVVVVVMTSLVLVVVVVVEVGAVVMVGPSQTHWRETLVHVPISAPVSFQHLPMEHSGNVADLQFPHPPLTSRHVSLTKNKPVRISTHSNSVVSSQAEPWSLKQHAPNPPTVVVMLEVVVVPHGFCTHSLAVSNVPLKSQHSFRPATSTHVPFGRQHAPLFAMGPLQSIPG